MSGDGIPRRRFLEGLTGVAGAAGIAGCSGLGDNEPENTDSTEPTATGADPTPTPEPTYKGDIYRFNYDLPSGEKETYPSLVNTAFRIQRPSEIQQFYQENPDATFVFHGREDKTTTVKGSYIAENGPEKFATHVPMEATRPYTTGKRLGPDDVQVFLEARAQGGTALLAEGLGEEVVEFLESYGPAEAVEPEFDSEITDRENWSFFRQFNEGAGSTEWIVSAVNPEKDLLSGEEYLGEDTDQVLERKNYQTKDYAWKFIEEQISNTGPQIPKKDAPNVLEAIELSEEYEPEVYFTNGVEDDSESNSRQGDRLYDTSSGKLHSYELGRPTVWRTVAWDSEGAELIEEQEIPTEELNHSAIEGTFVYK